MYLNRKPDLTETQRALFEAVDACVRPGTTLELLIEVVNGKAVALETRADKKYPGRI